MKYPLYIIALSSLACDLPPFTLIEFLERDFSMTYFCINNAPCMCMLFTMSFVKVHTYYLVASLTAIHRNLYGPKYIFHTVLNGAYILYESMYRF